MVQAMISLTFSKPRAGTRGKNDVALWLARVEPINHVQKRHNLPVKQHWRCLISSKLTMPYSREVGLPATSLHHPALPEPQSTHLVIDISCLQMNHVAGKVWQSDAVLLTPNNQQPRSMQINVQQVLGV